MRIPWPAAVAGAALVAVGSAGLIRAAVPQAAAAGGTPSAPIVVTNAYVRQPAPPTDAAAAYFTVFNTTGEPDRLVSVTSGAGATSILHATVNGKMKAATNGIVIPAHGSLVLSTGQGHVMIEELFGPLPPGQNVNLELVFATAGPIEVSAPVIALGAPAPGGSAPASTVPTSGATK
jgi:periplasmic copper chaperone A